MQARRVAPGAFALLLAAAFLAADAARDTMSIGQWAIDSPAFGGPHPRAEYELPDGVKRDTPAADRYWNKWLQCSSLVAWCTPEEVACGCTFEPDGDGAWYKGRFDWNSGKDPKIWPPCQPGLPALYAKCDAATKRASSCIVPKSMRVWNGNGTCVNHALCGDYYCKVRAPHGLAAATASDVSRAWQDKVQATRAPFV